MHVDPDMRLTVRQFIDSDKNLDNQCETLTDEDIISVVRPSISCLDNDADATYRQ